MRNPVLGMDPDRRISRAPWSVLGLIVQEVSGVGYGEFVGQEIFGPLGMDDSYSDVTLAQANGLATGTITWFGLPVTVSQTAFPGSVPDDYLISTEHGIDRPQHRYDGTTVSNPSPPNTPIRLRRAKPVT